MRKSIIRKFRGFVGSNPDDLLIEIMNVYGQLEKEASNNPTFYNLTRQLYVLIDLYRLKFG